MSFSTNRALYNCYYLLEQLTRHHASSRTWNVGQISCSHHQLHNCCLHIKPLQCHQWGWKILQSYIMSNSLHRTFSLTTQHSSMQTRLLSLPQIYYNRNIPTMNLAFFTCYDLCHKWHSKLGQINLHKSIKCTHTSAGNYLKSRVKWNEF